MLKLLVKLRLLRLFIGKATIIGQSSAKSFITSCFSCLIPLGSGDLLAHHAIALGLHISILILLKGSLDGIGSNLILT